MGSLTRSTVCLILGSRAGPLLSVPVGILAGGARKDAGRMEG